MEFRDKDNRTVTLNFKTNKDTPSGNHVLTIPIYNHQLLFTRHKVRGVEFPGGKVESGETLIRCGFKGNYMKRQAQLLRNVFILRNIK